MSCEQINDPVNEITGFHGHAKANKGFHIPVGSTGILVKGIKANIPKNVPTMTARGWVLGKKKAWMKMDKSGPVNKDVKNKALVKMETSPIAQTK